MMVSWMLHLVVPSAFPSFSPTPLFKRPCHLVGPLAVRSDELPDPAQKGDSRAGCIGDMPVLRSRKILEGTIRKLRVLTNQTSMCSILVELDEN